MWVKKDGYRTKILANAEDLSSPKAEIQLVRFLKGKYSHYHKRKTEFFFFLAGEGKVKVDKKEIKLKAGSYLLVKPNTVHTFINESQEALEAIMFKTNSSPKDTFRE